MTATELTQEIDRLIRARIAEAATFADGSVASGPFAGEAMDALKNIERGLKENSSAVESWNCGQ